MKEIVVISGKGGTGKTSLTASFSVLGGQGIVTADCDVDAADMHLLLEPDFALTRDFYSGVLAKIDPSVCTGCNRCAEVCRYGAIDVTDGLWSVLPLECEGCGYCARVCPAGAISMPEQNVGEWYRSSIKTGGTMVHARLGIGAENSGKLVAKVKNEARSIAEAEGRDIVLVDGSPGIGCPVVSSLSGADFVVLVTEPTVAGVHDLKRVNELVRRFGIPAGAVINKADLNPEVSAELKRYLEAEGVLHLADLPYDESFTEAMVMGQTIVEYRENGLKEQVSECWRSTLKIVRT